MGLLLTSIGDLCVVGFLQKRRVREVEGRMSYIEERTEIDMVYADVRCTCRFFTCLQWETYFGLSPQKTPSLRHKNLFFFTIKTTELFFFVAYKEKRSLQQVYQRKRASVDIHFFATSFNLNKFFAHVYQRKKLQYLI